MENFTMANKNPIEDRMKRIPELEKILRSQIIGQDVILPLFCENIKYGWCKLNTPGRPRGTMFLLGPTGVGKTESVRVAVEFMYGNADANILRLDMSEFSRQAGEEALINLIGAPGGKSQGRLGDFLLNHSEGVILYDEIEKSHPQIFTILLQQLDAARITLSNNQTYDLSNFFIIATSNIGAQVFQNIRHLSAKRLEQTLDMQLKDRFSPEFVARFGKFGHEILIFRPLKPEHLRQIAGKFFLKLLPIYKQSHQIEIRGFSEDAVEEVIRSIDNTKNGARELRSSIERKLRRFIYTVLVDSGNKPLSGYLDVEDENFILRECKDSNKGYYDVIS